MRVGRKENWGVFEQIFFGKNQFYLNYRLEPSVIQYSDSEPECLPEIKKQITAGFDALIWNTKHRLTGEILDLAGERLDLIKINLYFELI